MKTQTNTNTHRDSSAQNLAKAKTIKLGIDVHADSYRVVRQIDHATPQPAQKFAPKEFLVWAGKQREQADEVHSCYEAGPFGYQLHRQLKQLGIHNLVIRPQNWDEQGKGVKTDRTDALALVQRLDRYVQGNRNALAVIAVPTPQQEQQRTLSRRREQLQKDRQGHEAQGRSLLLYHGWRVKGQWWRAAAWQRLQHALPDWLKAVLESVRTQILTTDGLLTAATSQIESQAQPQAKGFGRLTSEVLRREVFDWHRFQNRRQVAG